MRIGVNTRLLLAGKMDGIGWFASETLQRMVIAHPEHDFYFFFDRKPDPRFIFAENVHPVVLCPQARHPILWYIFFEISLTLALKKHRVDVFFSPESYISLRTNVPTLSVMHDINFEHANDYLRPSHQRYMTYYSPKFAFKSTRVATVSQFSKQDIVDVYHLDPSKIDVIYNGVNEGYHPVASDVQQGVRDRYAQGCRYFIFIGTILKRKNLANLFAAFDRFKESDAENTKLLVVGNRVWWQGELVEAYENMRYKQDVVFVGRAPQDELFELLGSALALVYPSLFEGFGIPIIEGFKAEVPVITSNCTAMPEVAEDAALLVDPNSIDDISAAMSRVASSELLRQELVAKGRKQASRFSWAKTASLLWASLEWTYSEGGAR